MQRSRIITGRPKFHIRARYIMYDNERYELDPKGKLIKTDQTQPQPINPKPLDNDIMQNVPVYDTSKEEFKYYNSYELNPSEIFIGTPSNDCNYELDSFFDPLNDIDYLHDIFGEDF
ncbi:hypothetical protein GPJ56_008924 [Histomonas meleagridis]|uniref:uncharacterized protein n=1 Tax=Histomonas meleagridis TaxID=135588 RepID=UPI00355AB6EF|nr:hypothetical protein GPJ56_008924 [Histomonas meleagridis]KAH0797850.1 hypothetical protein GO595_009479 [Histomonas meleagridis]